MNLRAEIEKSVVLKGMTRLRIWVGEGVIVSDLLDDAHAQAIAEAINGYADMLEVFRASESHVGFYMDSDVAKSASFSRLCHALNALAPGGAATAQEVKP